MSTDNSIFALEHPDDGVPSHERVNGTSWWGATILGLVFAAFGFLMHLSQGNLVGPFIFTIGLVASYLPMFRTRFNDGTVVNRMSTITCVAGFLLLGLLLTGIFIITTLPSEAFNLPLAIFTGLFSGIVAFGAAKFLLPTIQEIQYSEN